MPPDRCRGIHCPSTGRSCLSKLRMIQDAKQFVVFAIPRFTCRVLQETYSCCTSSYNLKSSLGPQGIWQRKVRVSNHRTCDRCSRRYWPCESCCCSRDILTYALLDFSLGVLSPLIGDGLCLVNRSSELYVRWNYCYVIWNKHVLVLPRLPLQYLP